MAHRTALVVATLTALTSTAMAQSEEAPPPVEPTPTATASETTPPAEGEEKKPKRGDFDAGGVVRLPSGPDEMGQYATFNWVAVDAVGRYFVLDWMTINGKVPLAIIKPGMTELGDPRLIGGMSMTLDARPQAAGSYVGLVLTGAYMREGAMLLSDKDFPLFVGDFQPGFAGGVAAQLKLSSLLAVSLTPSWVYQSGSEESLAAVQIPASAIVKLGSLLKVSADAGIFTGDDYSFGGDDGGRISAGASIDVKLGPIVAHAGAGVASLLTGGLYPSISDSVYVDVNVKYAK
jgi:hypothetical protein